MRLKILILPVLGLMILPVLSGISNAFDPEKPSFNPWNMRKVLICDVETKAGVVEQKDLFATIEYYFFNKNNDPKLGLKTLKDCCAKGGRDGKSLCQNSITSEGNTIIDLAAIAGDWDLYEYGITDLNLDPNLPRSPDFDFNSMHYASVNGRDMAKQMATYKKPASLIGICTSTIEKYKGKDPEGLAEVNKYFTLAKELKDLKTQLGITSANVRDAVQDAYQRFLKAAFQNEELYTEAVREVKSILPGSFEYMATGANFDYANQI